ncbi:MAG: Hpt domain-containing protein [Proteobacteria bacterium]|nr:Hpt domain-containing protein [Pseudomonadota bacterium]
MPDPNKGNPIVDMDELKEIMDNDMELIQDCFTEFLTDLPDLLGDIQTAISQKDAEKMNSTGHKLKGTLKYLAAEPAAKAAQVIESAGSNHDLENLDEKFSTLERECENLTAFIKGFTP